MPPQDTLDNHQDKRQNSHPNQPAAIFLEPQAQAKRDRNHAYQGTEQTVPMLDEFIVGGSEPWVKKHIATIGGGPVLEGHSSALRRHQPAHTDQQPGGAEQGNGQPVRPMAHR